MPSKLKYTHNRKGKLKDSMEKMRSAIDSFANQKEMDIIYSHFNQYYGIPKNILAKDIKKYLASNYDFFNSRFSKKLNFNKIIKSGFLLFGFFVYSLINAKKTINTFNKYALIVEWIASKEELDRFNKLINYFSKKNVLITSVTKLNEKDYNIIYCPVNKGLDYKETLKKARTELIHGFIIYLKLSFLFRLNFFSIANNLIWQYLYYFSIFKYNRAKFCIQERHYQTSAIKNHLFKKFGGKYSATLQKNIIPRGNSSSYYTGDILFSLGNRTAERSIEQGASFDRIVPVGSLFGEYYWFANNSNNTNIDKKYDIINIGGNALGKVGGPFDITETHINNYYNHFKWLSKLSKEFPHLRIGIIHHGGEPADKIEMDIISGTNITRLDSGKNSYKIAFNSKCVVTYASTMAYELLAHGLPTFFIDPNKENNQFLPEDGMVDKWRITDYQQFRLIMKDLTLTNKLFDQNAINFDDLCLNSSNTSEKIYKYFIKNN